LAETEEVLPQTDTEDIDKRRIRMIFLSTPTSAYALPELPKQVLG
jgi:hypothetical protein